MGRRFNRALYTGGHHLPPWRYFERCPVGLRRFLLLTGAFTIPGRVARCHKTDSGTVL